MSNPIQQLFKRLAVEGQTALMPFVPAGDPDLGFTESLIRRLDEAGCHLLELGFPYSDPIADGPVIQASYSRALAQGLAVDDILAMASRLKGEIRMPIVAMTSYSIVYRRGVSEFVAQAAEAGFAGLIIPDLPVEESEELLTAANERGMAFNPLITPMTPDDRAEQIAATATGFIYFVSVVGITGEQQRFADQLQEKIARLRQVSTAPICIGFGISRPEHVAQLSPLADGLIVGSALVRRLADAVNQHREHEQTHADIVEFIRTLFVDLPDRVIGPR